LENIYTIDRKRRREEERKMRERERDRKISVDLFRVPGMTPEIYLQDSVIPFLFSLSQSHPAPPPLLLT
jgi:hypothetical protein